MRKILYLGGFYQAEFSLKRSFNDNGVEVTFLIDDNDYTRDGFWTNPAYQNYRNKVLTKIVPYYDLEDFVDSYKPDVIIHRYYLYKPIMHLNSLEIARKKGIPFVHLEMEMSQKLEENKDPVNVCTDCDIFLYAHDYKTPVLKYLKENKKACYFYPYGVSSFERSILNITKDREIGGFGYPRIEERERCHNLNMFLEGIAKLRKKLHVYGDWKYSPWIDFKHLEIHPSYSWEESTQVMNRHKIAINFETIANVEGAYSHKLFQSVGCGVPTLTYYKKSLCDLFISYNMVPCLNPVPVSNSGDVSDLVNWILNSDIHQKDVGKEGEEFIHEKFDWFQRFWIIMKKEGVW